MSDHNKRLALELLSLEKKSVQRLLSPAEKERWDELSQTFFEIQSVHPQLRRCFRIPAFGRCTILYKDSSYDCLYHEIGWYNFTLSGDLFEIATPNDTLILNALEIEGKRVELRLHCKLIRLRQSEPPKSGGVEIKDGNSSTAIEIYTREIYETAFFSFLEKKAA